MKKYASALVALPLLLSLPAAAATWTVDPAKSQLGFSGTQTGAAFKGSFGKWTADIAFDPDHPETGHAKVQIDLASAKTGDPQRDGALPEDDWFAVKKFPEATFEATSFIAKGNGQYEAPGKLTIRGVAKDVVLPFTLTITGDEAHAQGHLQLVRTSFGIGQGMWATADYVALEVGVDVDLVAKKTGN